MTFSAFSFHLKYPCMSTAVPHDVWSEWLLEQRFAHLSEAERADTLRALRFFRDTTLRHASLAPGQTVVDLGAGTGLLAHRAAELVGTTGRVIAVDLSRKSLMQLVANGSPARIERITADARALPLNDASTDRIVMRSVLIYIENADAVLRECARVLQVGGRLAICEPLNAQRYHTVSLEHVSPALGDGLNRMRLTEIEVASPMYQMAPDYLATMVEQAGLVVREQTIIDDVEPLTDEAAVERYLCRVPAPGRPTIAEQYEQALGAAAWGELRALWLAYVQRQPLEWRTPMLYLAAEPFNR